MILMILWFDNLDSQQGQSNLALEAKMKSKIDQDCEKFHKEKAQLKFILEKIRLEINSLNIKTIIEVNVYEKIQNLTKLVESRFIFNYEKNLNLDKKNNIFTFNAPKEENIQAKINFQSKRISSEGISFILNFRNVYIREHIGQVSII